MIELLRVLEGRELTRVGGERTVEIDARDAVRPYTEGQTRPIKFEVIMERATKEDIRYAGPVGKIDFSAMNGRMDVAYDYTIKDLAERQ